MKQTHLLTGADFPSPNENISVPFESVRTVEHYLGSIGILDHLDTFKTKGIPISSIVTAMCTHTLMGNNSMSRCSDWLSNPYVCKEMGFEKGISQRTINRALEILGDHSDEMVVELWKGMDSKYHFKNTDINIDGSATVVNGPNAELGEVGYPRDFRDQSRPQVEFIVAELQQSRIPSFHRIHGLVIE